MAFVVEDGTGVSNANSYASVAFYRAYHLDRGRDTTPDVDAVVEDWLVKATDFVEKRFGQRWKGTRKKTVAGASGQALGFPRVNVVVDGVTLLDTEVPLLLRHAVCEYALRVKTLGNLAPDMPVPFDRTDASGNTIAGESLLRGRREKVGPIEEEKQFSATRDLTTINKGSTTVPGIAIPSYPEADLLIEPLLQGGGSVGRTVRA